VEGDPQVGAGIRQGESRAAVSCGISVSVLCFALALRRTASAFFSWPRAFVRSASPIQSVLPGFVAVPIVFLFNALRMTIDSG
jgi:hypothetical protein